ncbi:UPF0176 protein pc0378 [Chlamydiales bacterium SCGC AG-110-P3]|nr:UPF0176 protein pc0378 [Chlamydiales bacterium SCGC AG-110-P3]
MPSKAEYVDTMHPYQVLAFYCFAPIEDPHAIVKAHKQWFKERDVTARIYVSEEGINGQMSIVTADAREYIDWVRSFTPFSTMPVKVQGYKEQAFPRLTVKYRKQLAALDRPVDMNGVGEHLAPSEWREMLEEKDHILIDVRNDYESKVGHFEGAELPNCNTFREFTTYAEELRKRTVPDKKVMMYCTGGIRCELYSSLLTELGFTSVYQLNGGVINYGAEENGKHWKGKLFVFDDRLSVPVGEDNKEVIGKCHHCNEPNETFYNCANVDCNELFLCCSECLPKVEGCCQTACQSAPRVREYQEQQHKPFRRWNKVVDRKCDLWKQATAHNAAAK